MEFVKATTKDGLILQGLFEEPKEKTNTVILHIHGMAGNFWENSFIKEMIKKYPDKGVAFLTVENRGAELLRWFKTTEGDEKLIGNAYEIFEDSPKDIQAWIDFLQSKGYNKIHLQGHSLGCAKIVYYLSMNNNENIKSSIFISASDMIGLCLDDSGIEEYNKFMKEAKELIKQGKGNQLLSGIIWEFAMQSANSYVNFSKENKNIAIFNYYNPELGFETLGKISVPILSFFGTKDDGIVTDPNKSNQMIKDNSPNCPKFVGKVFEGAKHDYEGFEEQITKDVLDFIEGLD